MNTKNVLVSLMAVIVLVSLVSVISADEIAGSFSVEVNGQIAGWQGFAQTDPRVSVVAGETIFVEIPSFMSWVNDTEVHFEVSIEGETVENHVISGVFDIEKDLSYTKGLMIEVPFELTDEISDIVYLSIELDGKDHKTKVDDIPLRVQRPSFYIDVKSVTADSSVDVGETFPVDIVLRNMGYNELNDVYVTATISGLGVSKGPTYFGDLVPLEVCDNDCDKEDTVSGRLYLDVPFGAEAGVYSLEVTVASDEETVTEVKQITIVNSLPNMVIVTNTDKTADVGENAEYTMLLVNPTNKLKVFKVMLNSDSGLYASASETIVAVSAGSSESVRILANADEAGTYSFSATILDGDALLDTVAFSLNAEGNGSAVTSPIMILSIVLAIIFIVLLIVLIVLIGKKPSKTEEFGESYY